MMEIYFLLFLQEIGTRFSNQLVFPEDIKINTKITVSIINEISQCFQTVQ